MDERLFMEDAIEAWEGEGGAHGHALYRLTADAMIAPSSIPAHSSPVTAEKMLVGTVNQVSWAEQIRARVSAEFDRVAKAIESIASNENEQDRMNTQAVIAILKDKRAEVMK